MRPRLKPVLLILICVFILPILLRLGAYAIDSRPQSWSRADWTSIGFLPPAEAHPGPRVLVLSGRTGRWKGVFAVHSWIVVKRQDAPRWTRYDVVGWGSPLRINGWAPDGRWFGDPPRVVADIQGNAAAALIPKIEAAISSYPYRDHGDYRIWPGPNSNTFVASVLRAVPDVGVALPPEAIGRDFRDGLVAGLSDSRTGIEFNAFGVLGLKLGLVEGIEVNVLGLVAGLDLRNPALKVPGYGRLGFGPATATAAVSRP